MKQHATIFPMEIISSQSVSNEEVRRLVATHALLLIDLLRRKCITLRYAEQALFNLDVVKGLEKRKLKDCVEIINWGMQLEDWEEHTPEQLDEGLRKISEMAQSIFTNSR